MNRQAVSLLLCAVLAVSGIAPALAADCSVYAAEAETQQSCGENLSWSLSDEGVLTITGTGAMNDFETAPWYDARETIRELELPEGLTRIGAYAFDGCTALEEVTIPASVTEIGRSAFRNCTGLKLIRFCSESCPDIYYNAMEGVTATALYPETWESLPVLSDSLTWKSYGEHSGICGENLTWSIDDNGVLTISGTGEMEDYTGEADSPWLGLDSISTVLIEEGVTSIGSYAFFGCEIGAVEIPASVTAIGTGAFRGTAAEIAVSAENADYSAQDGVLYDRDKTMLLHVPSGRTGSFAVPDGVANIDAGALWNCGLSEVNLPESVSAIGDRAFDSEELESVRFAGELPELAETVFAGCTVYYPDFWETVPEDGAYGAQWVAYPATEIALEPNELELENGQSETLTVSLKPEHAREQTVTWTTDNAAVATVQDGTVTAAGNGTATITATLENGNSASCAVTVTTSVSRIVLSKSELTLDVGGCAILTATVEPETASDPDVIWTSSDDGVAEVENGTVTAVEPGTAVITAQTRNGTAASCTVTVEQPVSSIALNKSSLKLNAGKSEQLTATVLPGNATDQTIAWTSSNDNVATVANGTVKAVGGGTAEITAKTKNGKTASCSVTALPAQPKTLKAASAGYNSIKVSWSKVTGAEGYVVYRKTADGWKRIGVVTGTSLTDNNGGSGLTAGTSYTYTVRAYIKVNGTEEKGPYDAKGVSAKPVPATVKLSKAAKSGTSIKVTWNKVAGASGYRIYRKVPGGAWSRIATVGSSTVSYTNKSLKPGTYTYTVRAYRTVNGNQILGGYDTDGVTASILPSTPKLTGASAAKGSITVKWSKVSNANGYRVYRKTGSSGWTRIANISKNSTTSYRDTNVKAGTTYIYTVRACANTGNTVVLSGYNTKGVSAKAK